MIWTPLQTETLRRMWADGDTFGQIARALKTTRSAVAGKCKRLNLERGHIGRSVKQQEKRNAREATRQGKIAGSSAIDDRD